MVVPVEAKDEDKYKVHVRPESVRWTHVLQCICTCQVVRVNMRLANTYDRVSLLLKKRRESLDALLRDPARRRLIVQHRINDNRLARNWIGRDEGPCCRRIVVEAVHSRGTGVRGRLVCLEWL